MALTDAEKVKLVDILGIDLQTISGHLLDVASFITSDTETSVREDFDLWDANYTKDHISITANERNFGANINYRKFLDSLKIRVATKLYFDTTKYGIGGQKRLLRG